MSALFGEASEPFLHNVRVQVFGRLTDMGVVYNRAQLIGTQCAAAACVISVGSIVSHLRRNTFPQIRSSIVRILLLVPVYAVDACLGLQRSRLEVPRQLLRQAYEAYALLCFMKLVLACLGAQATSDPWLGHGVPDKMRAQVIQTAQVGIWQYAILCGVVNTLAAFAAWLAGVYHDGVLEVTDAYLYCATLQFVSQSWALWSIAQLVHCTYRELTPMRPIAKFMCIKLIIFFTWMQTLAIYMLENVSSLGEISLWIETERRDRISHWWDPFRIFDTVDRGVARQDAWQDPEVRNQIGSGLGNLVLCIEMVAFAVMHCYAYSASEWDAFDKDCAGHRLLRLRCGSLSEPLLSSS